jgi:predicted permease
MIVNKYVQNGTIFINICDGILIILSSAIFIYKLIKHLKQLDKNDFGIAMFAKYHGVRYVAFVVIILIVYVFIMFYTGGINYELVAIAQCNIYHNNQILIHGLLQLHYMF